jgi:hypothetical protein
LSALSDPLRTRRRHSSASGRRPRRKTALSSATCGAVIEGRRRQRNRRLLAFSFRFLNRQSEKRTACAQECAPHGCAQSNCQPTTQSIRLVTVNAKGDGFDVNRLHRFAIERVPVSVIFTYTSRGAVRWPSGRRRRFAKPSRIPSGCDKTGQNSRFPINIPQSQFCPVSPEMS